MPTSPQQKTPAVFCDFLQIRNICERADVGIGPYDHLFRHAGIWQEKFLPDFSNCHAMKPY